MKSTFIAASAFVASALAISKEDYGTVTVVNRCAYDVYLWSIDKQLGCSSDASTLLKTGGSYSAKMVDGTNGGISVKLSKSDTCGGKDITQLEYKIDPSGDYAGNYLDMSFVDCTKNLEDCPGRTDGFYLKSGSQTGLFKSSVNNEHCPVFSVYNSVEAALVSYINWDDRQTKYCDASQDLALYLCGGHAPGEEDDSSSSAAPSSSTQAEQTSAKPTSASSSSEEAASSTTEEAFVVAAAAAVTEAPKPAVVKTEVVYVTKFIEARHAHARRHAHFHA